MMTARELREQRAGVIAKAREMLNTAAAEKRDLTAEESAAYDQLVGNAEAKIVGEIGALDTQIARYEQQETLEAGLEERVGRPPVKPNATVQNVMKRAEWEKLSPVAQRSFATEGGKIED